MEIRLLYFNYNIVGIVLLVRKIYGISVYSLKNTLEETIIHLTVLWRCTRAPGEGLVLSKSSKVAMKKSATRTIFRSLYGIRYLPGPMTS